MKCSWQNLFFFSLNADWSFWFYYGLGCRFKFNVHVIICGMIDLYFMCISQWVAKEHRKMVDSMHSKESQFICDILWLLMTMKVEMLTISSDAKGKGDNTFWSLNYVIVGSRLIAREHELGWDGQFDQVDHEFKHRMESSILNYHIINLSYIQPCMQKQKIYFIHCLLYFFFKSSLTLFGHLLLM